MEAGHSSEDSQAEPLVSELALARQVLRTEQERYATSAGVNLSTRPLSLLNETLAALRFRKQFETSESPEYVKRGAFKYVRQTEETRIALADELVRRVDPGPFEDPNYLAFLAYQAASIEMAMQGIDTRQGRPWSKFLLGTIACGDVNAFANVRKDFGYTIVHVYSALVDFVYQSAKAVVAALNPRRTLGGTITTANLDCVWEQLKSNPEPAERVYATLEAHFFHGYPRAAANEELKDVQAPALAVLVGMSERFIIAHEYGHAPAAAIAWRNPHVENPHWAEEFFADQQAAIATVLSGAALDRFPPEVSLSGGVFCLACLDLLRRSDVILRTGQEVPDEGSRTHPPCDVRAAQIVDRVHQWFDISYESGFRGFSLALAPKPDVPPINEAVRKHVREGAFFPTRVLHLIWKLVGERLRQDHQSGRRMHSSRLPGD